MAASLWSRSLPWSYHGSLLTSSSRMARVASLGSSPRCGVRWPCGTSAACSRRCPKQRLAGPSMPRSLKAPATRAPSFALSSVESPSVPASILLAASRCASRVGRRPLRPPRGQPLQPGGALESSCGDSRAPGGLRWRQQLRLRPPLEVGSCSSLLRMFGQSNLSRPHFVCRLRHCLPAGDPSATAPPPPRTPSRSASNLSTMPSQRRPCASGGQRLHPASLRPGR
mmetsp:Transcript_80748/g.261775  ORF Transcript_80748/g.261775 Transcript_80748/m.261775 type:complete len:226 (+) Transcript_80748:1415-2092(+)